MSKQTEALKLALECVEAWDRGCDRDPYWRDIEAAVTAIKEALAEQPAQQEPVAEVRLIRTGGNAGLATHIVQIVEGYFPAGTKLYTSPTSKPLTDEQWQVIADTLGCLITRSQKDVIEATLGITGGQK